MPIFLVLISFSYFAISFLTERFFTIGVIISEQPNLTPYLGRSLRLYQLVIDECVVGAIGRLICQWPGIHECLYIPSVNLDDYSHQFFILFAAYIIVSCTVSKWDVYGRLRPHLIPLFAAVLTILPWSSCSTSSFSSTILSRSVSHLLLVMQVNCIQYLASWPAPCVLPENLLAAPLWWS